MFEELGLLEDGIQRKDGKDIEALATEQIFIPLQWSNPIHYTDRLSSIAISFHQLQKNFCHRN